MVVKGAERLVHAIQLCKHGMTNYRLKIVALSLELKKKKSCFSREIDFTKNFVKINFTKNLFHYQFCFQAVVMVIESMHEKTEEAMCKLLQALFRSFIISIDQMKNVS